MYMYISHSSKIPGQPRDELQWEEEEEEEFLSIAEPYYLIHFSTIYLVNLLGKLSLVQVKGSQMSRGRGFVILF